MKKLWKLLPAIALVYGLSAHAEALYDPPSHKAMLISPDIRSGTTVSVLSSDKGRQLILTNTSGVAVSLPPANSVQRGWYVALYNSASSLGTITPAGSTIDGQAAFYVIKGQSLWIMSDGANWQVHGKSVVAVTIGANVILSGRGNIQNASGSDAVIAGGASNTTGSANYETISGGQGNSATGQWSTVVGGENNNASGQLSVAGGFGNAASSTASIALGESCAASAEASICLGKGGISDGLASFAAGQYTTTRGTAGAFVEGGLGGIAATSSFPGRAQSVIYTLFNSTSGATASRLTTDGGAASTSNIGKLQGSVVASWTCDVMIANRTTPGNSLMYSIGQSYIRQGANAAATTLGTGNPTAVAGPTEGSVTLQAAPTLTVDTTLGGFNLSYTPPAANSANFYAVARCRSLETTIN